MNDSFIQSTNQSINQSTNQSTKYTDLDRCIVSCRWLESDCHLIHEYIFCIHLSSGNALTIIQIKVYAVKPVPALSKDLT